MSNGSNRRPENPDKEPGAYERNYEKMKWPSQGKSTIPWGKVGQVGHVDIFADPDVPEDAFVIVGGLKVAPHRAEALDALWDYAKEEFSEEPCDDDQD